MYLIPLAIEIHFEEKNILMKLAESESAMMGAGGP